MRGSKCGTLRRVAPIHALVGAAVLGLLVMPLAFAGAKPKASASAPNLRKQVKSLKKRVAALESRSTPGTLAPTIPTTLPPSGRAGGDLAGSYPNPQIAPNAVGTGEIADNQVRPEDIFVNSLGQNQLATASVGIAELAQGAVGSFAITDGGVGQADLSAGSVGAGKLKGTYERVSNGTGAPPDTFVDATATCNPGDRVLGGGYAWLRDSAFETQATAPNASGGGFDNPDQWAVRAKSAIDNELFAWAVCISA
jgi:hypothetical protein